MDDDKIDPAMMGRLAASLTFICGAEHPVTVAMRTAATSGTARDVKAARSAFLKLEYGDRRAALEMLKDGD